MTRILLWASLLAPPFVFINGLPVFIEMQKAFALRFLLLAAFLFSAFSVTLFIRIKRNVAALIIMNLAWMSVSLLANDVTRQTQLAYLDPFLALAALPLFAAFLSKGRGLGRLLTALALAAAAIALLGFLNRYLPKKLAFFHTAKIIATFTHPNLLAQYLAPVLPILAALSLAATHRFKRFFFLMLFPVVLIPFLLTYTRGGILAAGFGCALACLGALFIFPKGRKPFITLGSLALIGMICLAVFWGFDRPNPKRKVVLEEIATVSNIESSSLKNRIALWKQGWRIVQQHPWLGCGPGHMQTSIALKREPGDPEGRRMHQDVHQDLLQHAAQFGIPALLLLLGLLAVLMKGAIQTAKDPKIPPEERILYWALLCGAITVFVHGLIDFPLSRSVPRLYAFAFMGMAAAPHMIRPPAKKQNQTPGLRLLACVLLLGFVLGAGKIGLVDEGRAFLFFRQAFVDVRNKDMEGLRTHCSPILADRGAGYFLRYRCLSLTSKSLGPQALPLAEQLAADYPGHYQAAWLLARSYLKNNQPEAACAQIQRGISIWWKHPGWKPFLEHAIEKAQTQQARQFCKRVKEMLPEKGVRTNQGLGLWEYEDHTGEFDVVP